MGTYAPGPQDRPVDERWSTKGIPSSFYSRHKAEVERRLDEFEERNSSIRVVRLRPGLIFKREAASEIRRYFAGPLLPNALLRRGLIPFIPNIRGLRFQVVHANDVAQAYRLAITRDVRGAFNIAADPVLDLARVARLFKSRPLPLPPRLIRGAASVSWRLHLQPTPPGWVDMALQAPVGR